MYLQEWDACLIYIDRVPYVLGLDNRLYMIVVNVHEYLVVSIMNMIWALCGGILKICEPSNDDTKQNNKTLKSKQG